MPPDDGTYVFNAGTRVETNFDWRLIPITYEYAFWKTERLEAAAALGVHWFRAAVGFAGSATVTPPGGAPVFLASTATAESVSGPLPVIGANADFALSDNWTLGARTAWFGLDYEDYSGQLWDLGVTAEYWVTEHLAAGVGYSLYSIDVTETMGAFRMGADFTHHGLEVFLSARF